MTVDESILRRAFVDYEAIPEPPKFPPKYDEPLPSTNEDVGRNVEVFPDLYLFLSVRSRTELAMSSAWGWLTQVRGGSVDRPTDPSRSGPAT